ncbi:MAG: Anthranilate/para-aminobenzoate synthases component I [Verrucomicrobia bacterium]|nr:MAG: Anthranilate/para-aminobenzoate synthases component I [Verrucomicrobiota bacterium]
MQPRFQPIPELAEFTPLELAARARAAGGMAFFDSAKDIGVSSNLSLLALKPEAWLEGSLFVDADCQLLQAAVAEISKGQSECDDGLPGSVVAGAVEYDGRFCFAVYRQVLVYRHREAVWYGAGDWWRRLLRQEASPAALEGDLVFTPTVSKDVFCQRVARAQDYIGAGDIYQVNLSHRFTAAWPGGEPWAFYEALRHYSPAPFSAFLDQPGRAILSSSPEQFLKFSGRSVQTRPIKGTRPRRSEWNADERSAFDLLTSPKEIAELVMITDLERNDLGQFCEWGSVEVSELLKLERHEQVFHLVSTVQGRMRKEIDPVSALRACFPGGSITGAPKRRAREIITELESTPRGLYTGAAGWFGAGGESVFNILIRTVVVENGCAHFHVGAGVVADSVPEAEWQETWDKASGILLAAERIARRRAEVLS